MNEIFTYENIITYQLIWILAIWFVWRVVKNYLLPKTTPDESIKISYFEERVIENVALNLHKFIDIDFSYNGKDSQDGTYKAVLKNMITDYSHGPFFNTELRFYNYSSSFRNEITLKITKYHIPKDVNLRLALDFPPHNCEGTKEFNLTHNEKLEASYLEISSNKLGKKQNMYGAPIPVSRFIQIEMHRPEGQIEQPTEKCKENISNALKDVLIELFTFREDDKWI